MYTCVYYIYERFVIKVIQFTVLWFLKCIDFKMLVFAMNIVLRFFDFK